MGRRDNKFLSCPMHLSKEKSILFASLFMCIGKMQNTTTYRHRCGRCFYIVCAKLSLWKTKNSQCICARNMRWVHVSQPHSCEAKHDTLCLCRGQCAKRNSGRTPPARSVASMRLKDVTFGPICIFISRLFVWAHDIRSMALYAFLCRFAATATLSDTTCLRMLSATFGYFVLLKQTASTWSCCVIILTRSVGRVCGSACGRG